MKITFEAEDLKALKQQLKDFLLQSGDELVYKVQMVGEAAEEPSQPAEEAPEPPKEEKPAEVQDRRAGRRSRRSKPEEEKPAEEATEKPRGRRARKPSATAEAPKAADKTLTDVALTMHASRAAEAIGPKAVKEVLKELGAKGVSDLEGSDREAFVTQLTAAVAEKADE